MRSRVVFMGSPEFALPSLRALARSTDIVGVVTQPDRPAGRGRSLTPPPVKLVAQELGLPILQPERLRAGASIEDVSRWRPEVVVVAAYGQILPASLLEIPPFGCLNVHASLLPRWRGAAPVQAAIMAGDQETGVTIMKMDEGLDTGDILSQRAIAIRPTDTGGTLTEALAELGAELLMETLPGYLEGKITPQPQPDSGGTLAPTIKSDERYLDLAQDAAALARKVRAFHPRPGARLKTDAGEIKVLAAHATPGATIQGAWVVQDDFPGVGTADGTLILDEVQPAGKVPMSGKAFLAGLRAWPPARSG